ncbi:MAG: Panacea domain-containing protein [Tumebacillaceae bacterium]
MPLTTVQEIADVFLSMESMSHKKLQKLCYYAYSWFLALNNESLFQNSFQAWVHGPVDPALYQTYRGYGWQPIPLKDQVETDEEILQFLKSVYEAYGHLTGDQLEALTHREQPWLEARGNLPEYAPCNTLIADETIRSFYLSEFEKAQHD